MHLPIDYKSIFNLLTNSNIRANIFLIEVYWQYISNALEKENCHEDNCIWYIKGRNRQDNGGLQHWRHFGRGAQGPFH